MLATSQPPGQPQAEAYAARAGLRNPAQGFADLRGATLSERRGHLIAIAHPAFREAFERGGAPRAPALSPPGQRARMSDERPS